VRKFEVYVETSVWGAVADVEPAISRENAARLLADTARFAFFISPLVLYEISEARTEIYEKVMAVVGRVAPALLTVTAEVQSLADAYISRRVFPRRYEADAVHVACASVYGIPYLVSYNFRHIVRPSTRSLIRAANNILGYTAPELLSPEELWGEAGDS
jgi:predicted nucleic acid-binding protein